LPLLLSIGSYIFYNDFAWLNDKQPVNDVFVKRDTFVHHQGADNTTQYPIKITSF
jgi:hypothetical protein